MTHSPKTANGHSIIASSVTPGDPATRVGRVILVDRGGDNDRYVTAWIADGDASWCWGHYFYDLIEARADFVARMARGY